MTGVIYADVLFIINTYITYILLFSTAFLAKQDAGRTAMVLSSLLGGVYSFVIFLGEINTVLSVVLRLAAAAIFILCAFKIRSRKHFFKLYSLFFLVNFIFAGLMMAVWYAFSPTVMYFSDSILYLDINSLTLVLLSVLCYFAIKGISAFWEFKTPKSRIFETVLTVGEKNLSLRAFLDTGNSLKDPFTGDSVLIVSGKSIKSLCELDIKSTEIQYIGNKKVRFIPCNTVSGGYLIPIFRADSIKIKGIEKSFVKRDVLIGVTENEIKNGDYDMLLCDEIFENI